jgi:hypothetical protein
MAYGITLTFDGVGEDKYWAVNEHLGIDRDGNGNYPDGLLVHTGGSTGGGWYVAEIWESKAHQEKFMADRLGAALGAEQLPPPTVVEADLVNVKVLS